MQYVRTCYTVMYGVFPSSLYPSPMIQIVKNLYMLLVGLYAPMLSMDPDETS